MKKITFNINGSYNQDDIPKIAEALNSLSGIVAADVSLVESKAYAYSGDQLTSDTIAKAAANAGYSISVSNEEYLSDLGDIKSNMV